jgi:hypothetical protein
MNYKHSTDAGYKVLVDAGADIWFGEVGSANSGSHYYGYVDVEWDDLFEPFKRDILTMHALRWLSGEWFALDVNHRKGYQQWQFGIMDASQNAWHQEVGEDLFDAIVEAVLNGKST